MKDILSKIRNLMSRKTKDVPPLARNFIFLGALVIHLAVLQFFFSAGVIQSAEELHFSQSNAIVCWLTVAIVWTIFEAWRGK